MKAWVAIAHGSLDIRSIEQVPGIQATIAVTPVQSAACNGPLAFGGAEAALWQRLTAEGPVADDLLTPDEQRLVQEFVEVGIASEDPGHAAIAKVPCAPWFPSFQHELGCALVASVAQDLDIRCVIIKGPVLRAQGLRHREHSGDIDVWVDEAGSAQLIAALQTRGWVLRPSFLQQFPEILHSYTLQPTVWSSEIDVHVRYPGAGSNRAEHAAAFEALWRESEQMVFAGVAARVPNRESHAVIQALTLTRPVPGTVTDPLGVNSAAADVLAKGGPRVPEVARALGADAALRGALQAAFPQEEFDDRPPPPDWRWLAQPNPVYIYLQMLRALPMKRWPIFLWRALTHDDGGSRTPGRMRRATRQIFQRLSREAA